MVYSEITLETPTPKTKTIAVQAFGATDIGQRKSNEDAYLIDEGVSLFIVADGMGGHAKGEVASWFTSDSLMKMAVYLSTGEDTVTETTIDPGISRWREGKNTEEVLKYAILTINEKIYKQNEEMAGKEIENAVDPVGKEIAKIAAAKKRMGTTLVSLFVRGGRAYLTHIGDSRAYRIANGEIHQMTRDHSWVMERLCTGELTPEEAKTHKKKNVITRSVGVKAEVKADIDAFTLHPPERFLLCSDGLSGVLTADELLKLAQTVDLKSACENMVALAKRKGGKDNITAVLVDVFLRSVAEEECGRLGGDETLPHISE